MRPHFNWVFDLQKNNSVTSVWFKLCNKIFQLEFTGTGKFIDYISVENFRPTMANKSELEVCLYFFPIEKHV